jgi:succinate-semialdehyde dehydrogenase / glutarate-semialdehyde dehydrogenase
LAVGRKESRVTMLAIDHIREAAVLAGVPTQLLIGGTWRDSSSGATIAVDDPATGAVLIHVADATASDGMAALASAASAQSDWARTAPRERGEILRRAFETIVDRVDDLALLMTLESGKSLAESRAEVLYAAEFFRWFSEEAVRIGGRFATSPDGRTRLLTAKRPVGPCLFITPWNFRWRWAPARSALPSLPAAPWSSSPPSRRR